MKTLTTTLAAIGLLTAASAASAATVELTVTGTWTAGDFDVSGAAGSLPEGDDDLVFGIAPSAGSLSFTLLVDTSSVVAHPAGVGAFPPANDFFGYDIVSFKDPVSLGTATWDTSDILTGLVGPYGSTAALWSDTDLSTLVDPMDISFRAGGEWTGTGGTGTADLFTGTRFALDSDGTGMDYTDQFLIWEYFGGEEIRFNGFEISVAPSAPAVPLPASSLLLIAGLGGLATLRRRTA